MNRTVARTVAHVVIVALMNLPLTPPVAAQAKIARPPIAPTASAPELSPISLLDPDGKQLEMRSLTVRAAIHGPLALTELDMRFRNPKDRVSEGTFAVDLPAGATVSRFAKEVNGRLMEGEVVERLRANQVYEQFLHQMRDPALLEQDESNRFTARIFPLAPGAEFRVVLSYSRVLPLVNGTRTYSVPLRGLPEIAQFAFKGVIARVPGDAPVVTEKQLSLDTPSDVQRDTIESIGFERTAWRPDRDIEIRWNPSTESQERMLTSGDYFMASVRYVAPPRVSDTPRRVIAYLDMSASAAEGLRHRVRAIERFFASIPATTSVELIAFDQSLRPLVNGTAETVATRLSSTLREATFLGGTNLERVLRDAAKRADADSRVVLISDGMPSLGETRSADLVTLAGAIRGRVDAVVLGGEATPLLKQLTEGRGRVVSARFTERIDREVDALYARLLPPLGDEIEFNASGAEWIYPARVRDVQSGDEIVVFGRRRGTAAPSVTMRAAGSGARALRVSDEVAVSGFAALFAREANHAYLDSLGARAANESDPAVASAIAAERVRVSLANRVMIPETTMLVLESEADYERFNIERRALADILTVGASGIETVGRTFLIERSAPVLREPAPVRITARALSGVVTNDGAVLPGVSVSISSPSLQGVRMATSNGDGAFDFGTVPEGDYTVRFELSGLQTVTRLVRIDSAAAGGVDADLKISAVSESVTVTASSPVAASLESSAVQTNLEHRAVHQMPQRRGSQDAGSLAPSAPAPAPPRLPATEARAERDERAAMSGRSDERAPRTAATSRPASVPGPVSPAPRSDAISMAQPVPAADAPQRSRADWLEPDAVSGRVEELRRSIAAEPKDRQVYIALSEHYLRAKRWEELRALTLQWQAYDADNPDVYELLGEAYRGMGDDAQAARAFGSLADLAGTNSEAYQRAGLLLFRAGAKELAEAPLRKAVELRPDRINAQRHLALVLWLSGRADEAARVLEDALGQNYPGWYGNARRVANEELGYVYRSIIDRTPALRDDIVRRATMLAVDLNRRDALRVTLVWETDANDVDLHVADPAGDDCFYASPRTAGGLQLYEDITQGLGPEVTRLAKPGAGRYAVGVNYFNSGPMGVSRGIVVTMHGSKNGDPKVEITPFRLLADSHGKDVRLVTSVRL